MILWEVEEPGRESVSAGVGLLVTASASLALAPHSVSGVVFHVQDLHLELGVPSREVHTGPIRALRVVLSSEKQMMLFGERCSESSYNVEVV